MIHKLWTIGHSTKPIHKFIALLKAHDIQQLVDVRTVPCSRYNPQFNTASLAQSLTCAAISYQHIAHLGGLQKPKKDSANTGWRNANFRGYADHMQSNEFWNAFDELLVDSRELRTAIMCAEAVPWRCHRSLIADAVLTRGGEVQHILSEATTNPHQLTAFALFKNGVLLYPESHNRLRLF